MISNTTQSDTVRYGLPACWRMLYLNRKLRMRSIVVVCGLVIGILSKCYMFLKQIIIALPERCTIRGPTAFSTICLYMSLISPMYFIKIHSKYVRYTDVVCKFVSFCVLREQSQLTHHNLTTISVFLSCQVK